MNNAPDFSLPPVSTAVDTGKTYALFQAYLIGAHKHLHWKPDLEKLLTMAKAEDEKYVIYHLHHGEMALHCLDCLEIGSADALEYAVVLLRRMARESFRAAEQGQPMSNETFSPAQI